MFKRSIQLTALCLVFVLSTGLTQSQAQIQEDKIGYVNPQALLQRMPEMKAVQQRLQNFVQKKRESIAQKDQDFQDQVAEYQQKQSVISDAAKKKEEERLGQLQADLQQSQRQVQQEVQQKQQELVGPLYEEINTAIETVATRQDLAYVLNTTTNQGDLIILYASQNAQENYDITSQVMDELGIGS